jgi:hypothetical protein
MRHRRTVRLSLLAVLAAALVLLGSPVAANGPARTPAPDGASLYIVSPHPGEVVSSPLTVRFGLSGMGVAPAGVQNPKTGHHHLIIDSELPDLGKPVPADPKHLHFGGGQTQTVIELSPGNHTLQLILGDHLHIPFDPAIVSERITIEVE